MNTFSQRSFSGGIIAPTLQSRVDLQKYQTGLADCKNVVVMKHGGLEGRCGTDYVSRGLYKDGDYNEFNSSYGVLEGKVRLIPWHHSVQESYVLELGHKYLRIIHDGSYIKNFWGAITACSTVSGNARVTISKTNGQFKLKGNDIVYISGMVGVNNMNGRHFRVVPNQFDKSAGTVRLWDENGEVVTVDGTWSSGGDLWRVAQWKLPYHEDDLYKIRYSQTGRVLTLCCDGYQPYEIQRWSGTGPDKGVDYSQPADLLSNDALTSYRAWGVPTRFDPRNAFAGKVSQVEDVNLYANVEPEDTTEFIYAAAQLDAALGRLSDRLGYTQPPRDVDQGKEYIQYAVSCVTASGVESLPYYTDITRQPAKDYDVISTSCSVGGYPAGSLTDGTQGDYLKHVSSGEKVTWTTTEGGRKILISPNNVNQYYFPDGVVFVIHGTASDGKSVTESMSLNGQFEVSNNTSKNALVTQNYFRRVDGITATSDEGIYRVGLGDEDHENIRLTWDKPTRQFGDTEYSYKIYKSTGGRFGFIAETDNTFLVDLGQEPDYNHLPIEDVNPFAPVTDKNGKEKPNNKKAPRAVGSYQQRRIFGNTPERPERVFCSAIGQTYNYNTRSELSDEDPFHFEISGQKSSEIKHFLSIGKLIVFTDTGEWVINGSNSTALTPTEVNAVQHGHYGSGDVAPLAIGSDAVFISPAGPVIRDLGYNFESSGYRGNDLTVFANHLFRGYTIKDWCYQQGPDSIIWVVRSDGTLLGLTYLKEQQVMAWHRHRLSGGLVEGCCTVPELYGSNHYDAVYLVVKRTIDGRTIRTIERLMRKNVSTVDEEQDMDMSIVYDGVSTTTPGGFFALEGQEVSVLADGVVSASPNNPAFAKIVVQEDGTITLPNASAYVRVGLPMDRWVETLDIDSDGETLADKVKFVPRVTLHILDSNGIFVGNSEPDGSDYTEGLTEMKLRTVGSYDNSELYSGKYEVVIRPEWNSNGKLFIRQVDPLPLQILAIHPVVNLTRR